MEESSLISLNVGGLLYSTTRSTLSSHSPSLLSSYIQGDTSVSSTIHSLPDGTIFIDRDGTLFSIILNFLRTDRLILCDSFRDMVGLREEAAFYQLPALIHRIPSPSENGGGYITLGYRGTFAYGRDGQADVKFRKLQRILVHGKASLCREVFGDTLNESRDPGDHDFSDRYTTRLYLKHQCLEKVGWSNFLQHCDRRLSDARVLGGNLALFFQRACDAMAEKGFRLLSTCTSGANGLSSHQLMSSGLSPGGQNVTRMGRLKQGFFSANEDNGSEDVLNHHRNSGDLEEQRWAHYTEYVFYRDATTVVPTISNGSN